MSGVRVTQDFVVDRGQDIVTHPETTPIIINNFNRLRYLQRLLAALSTRGYENVYVIDNRSTYEPLLQYYRDAGLRVFYLDANVGYLALWTTPVGANFVDCHYVYTDVDIEPTPDCPDDFIAYFCDVLSRYPDVGKVGFGLQTDDLPSSYDLRDQVVEHERGLLADLAEPGLYRAPIDTTFALYRPGAEGGAWIPSIRTDRPYLARHLPWYTDSSHPDDEEAYYRATALTSSHWTMLDQVGASGGMTVMLWGEPVRVVANSAAHWTMVSRGEWEPDTYDALDWLVDRGSAYLELGSGVGETALYAARVARDVYAVECDVETYAELTRNLSMNAGDLGNVMPLNVRVALQSDPPGSLTFAALEEAHPLGSGAVIKMDIGGSEYDILPTMVPYLRETRPSLHLRLHPRRHFDIKGTSPLAKAVVGVLSMVSTARVLWLLRFYGPVYDARGSRLTLTGFPAACRGLVTLIFSDKAPAHGPESPAP
ncbi:MAG TPA: hypothetical protein VIK11_11760 [Tepidiformaceae bacterium]